MGSLKKKKNSLTECKFLLQNPKGKIYKRECHLSHKSGASFVINLLYNNLTLIFHIKSCQPNLFELFLLFLWVEFKIIKGLCLESYLLEMYSRYRSPLPQLLDGLSKEKKKTFKYHKYKTIY